MPDNILDKSLGDVYCPTPMVKQTHAQVAATALLQRPLAAYVAEKRAADLSWNRIARDLYNDIGLDITGESLRTWYGTEVAA